MFSSVIKGAKRNDTGIQSYSMRDMSMYPEAREQRNGTAPGIPAAPSKIDQLLAEIGEREKYIKQMTDRRHTVEKEAYEKGFSQGERAGRELGEKRFDSVITAFTRAAEGLGEIRRAVLRESEEHLLELVMTIARKVIQREVETDREAVVKIVRSAIDCLASRGSVRVKLHPSDLECVNQRREELVPGKQGRGEITLEGDEEIARGDAMIETNREVIHCGIEEHLRKVEGILRATARDESGSRQEDDDEAGSNL